MRLMLKRGINRLGFSGLAKLRFANANKGILRLFSFHSGNEANDVKFQMARQSTFEYTQRESTTGNPYVCT